MFPSRLPKAPPADPFEVGPRAREEEIRDLVWKAIDGVADEIAIGRLRNLVLTQREARNAFCNAVTLDQSLRAVFSGR
jgi:hypothetical protein